MHAYPFTSAVLDLLVCIRHHTHQHHAQSCEHRKDGDTHDADHTMALLLRWNRRIVDYHRFVADGRWNERPAANGEWGYDPPARLGTRRWGCWASVTSAKP